MFASQLLRILQTLPPDVNHETCTFDTAKVEPTMKENPNGPLSDINSCENNATEIASAIDNKVGFYKTLELQCSMVGEDSTNSNEKEVRGYVPQLTTASRKMESFDWDRDSCTEKDGDQNELKETVGPHAIPFHKMEVFERERELCTDKDVMECELPELVVCCKDNTCHVVKDICIDEGVPLKDKILINGKGLCPITPDGNQNGGMTGEEIELLSTSGSKSSSENDYHEVEAYECGNKEKVEIELVVSDELKSRSEYAFDDDIDNNHGSNVPSQTGEANHNATGKIVDDVSGEKLVTNGMPSYGKLTEQQSLKSLLESPDCDSNEVEQQSPQIPLSKPGCKSPDVVSAAEESNKSNLVNKLSYNSKVESATITFDFNSSKPEASSNGDESHEKALKIDSEPRHKNGGVSDSMAVLGEVHRGQGESSFSMAGPVSGGLITYSGSIPNSGSISLRSDSSTTSTRSFAFPVLPSEWNSSPVRMAKADRRHYQRRRGWRHGFLCCRF